MASQEQQISPSTGEETPQVATTLHPSPHTTDPSLESGRESPQGKAKSVIGKVKNKAKKLKTKIKKPKSPGEAGEDDASSSPYSSEDEGGNEDQQEHASEDVKENAEVADRGLRDATWEAKPDPTQEQFGKLSLESPRKLQEEVPSAPGQASAGVTPYLSEHGFGKEPETKPSGATGSRIEDGQDGLGRDILVTSGGQNRVGDTTPMDLEKPAGQEATDNAGAQYSPTVPEQTSGQESMKTGGNDAAMAETGGKLSTEEAEDKPVPPALEKKSMLAQAREKIFGSSRSFPGVSQSGANTAVESRRSETNSPTLTGKAAGTVSGLKDTLVSKLGYGTKASPAEGQEGGNVDIGSEAKNEEPSKSATEVLQEKATGAKDTVASNLGYEQKPAAEQEESRGIDTNRQQQKSYLQKMQETALGAKGLVTSKLGYNSSSDAPASGEASLGQPNMEQKTDLQQSQESASPAKDGMSAKLGDDSMSNKEAQSDESGNQQKSYLQKVQETALGAKDKVVSKLGYSSSTTGRDLPQSTDTNLSQQESPVSGPARFHPGEEDKALSQLITEKMSNSAATVKDTIRRPFGSKSSPSTPITTPQPSSATTGGLEGHTGDEEKPAGIVSRMTGAVSSLLGSSKKPSDASGSTDEATGKASEDPTAGVAAGKAFQDPTATGVCNVEMH